MRFGGAKVDTSGADAREYSNGNGPYFKASPYIKRVLTDFSILEIASNTIILSELSNSKFLTICDKCTLS